MFRMSPCTSRGDIPYNLLFNGNISSKNCVLKSLFITFSENTLKNKWRTLVGKFKSESNLESFNRSGDGAEQSYKSQWPHYQSLKFLSDTLDSAISVGNLGDLFNEEFDEDEEYFEEDEEDLDEESDFENISPNKRSSMSKRVKISGEVPTPKPKPPKKNVLDDDVSDMSNDDLLFFKTLAHRVKKIDEDPKLHFRNKVNTVVQKYVYGTDTETGKNRMMTMVRSKVII